jgi:hypothetical protein
MFDTLKYGNSGYAIVIGGVPDQTAPYEIMVNVSDVFPYNRLLQTGDPLEDISLPQANPNADSAPPTDPVPEEQPVAP